VLALRLNQASRWFLPPVVWLLLGVVGLVLRRPQRALALATPAIAGLVVIVLSALAIPSVPHYSVPVVPAFMLLAAGSLTGRRRRPS
jgi:CHASE2 domain-containing sensor protein